MSWKQGKLASLGEEHIWWKGAWREIARDGSRKGCTSQDVDDIHINMNMSSKQFTWTLGNGMPQKLFFKWAMYLIELRLKIKMIW